MALPKLYEQITWVNDTTPALNEDNLNAMSQALEDIDDRVIDLAGTIMEDVPQIIEDMAILGPAIESIDENVAAAEADKLESEGFAVGEQNGVPVDSSSPYYHNNAKYYSTVASGSSAAHITYNNSDSHLAATNVQGAVDELNEALTDLSSEAFNMLGGVDTGTYGIVDLGTLSYTKDTNTNAFYARITDAKNGATGQISNIACSDYKTVQTKGSTAETMAQGINICAMQNGSNLVFIKDGGKASYTAAQFKTAMSGVNLVYEKATATGGTADKSDLASISITGTTNSTGSTIASGTYFYLNGALVKAKTSIANGATLTANTNYVEVTAGGLNELKDALTELTPVSGTKDLNVDATITIKNGDRFVLWINSSRTVAVYFLAANTSQAYAHNVINTITGLTVTASGYDVILSGAVAGSYYLQRLA